MTGEVKYFVHKKGYGFITGENGRDYFVHANNCEANLVDRRNREVYLYQGDKVEFEPSETEKGLCALKVRKSNREEAKSLNPS